MTYPCRPPRNPGPIWSALIWLWWAGIAALALRWLWLHLLR